MLEAAKKSGLSFSDIDWFIPHQANKRIIELKPLRALSQALTLRKKRLAGCLLDSSLTLQVAKGGLNNPAGGLKLD